jgi:hypothetical protein
MASCSLARLAAMPIRPWAASATARQSSAIR